MSEITIRSVLAKFGFKVDDASLKKANKSVEDSKREIDKTEQAAKKLAGEFGKTASAAEIGFGKTARVARSIGTQIKQAEKAAEGLGSKLLDGFAGSVAGGLFGAASIGAIAGLSGFLGEATERTTEFDAAMAALPGGIDRAAAATSGLVDNFTLATTGAAALGAGLVKDGEQFGAFAGDVATLARKAGDNVGEAMGRMVDELKGGSTALLEQYGVTVDAEAAVASYAVAHGKLVEDLTETEKRHVVAAAAMTAMHEAATALGPALDTNAARLQRAGTRLQNFKDGLKGVAVTAAGETFGALESITGGIVEAAEAATKETEALRAMDAELNLAEGGMRKFGESVARTVGDLVLGHETVEQLIDASGRLGSKLAEAAANMPEVYKPTASELRAQKRLEQEQQAHEDEAAYQRMFYGPDKPPPKKGGAAKPGPAYELRTLQLITGATGDGGDDVISEMLAGYKQGKTAKKLSVEELYDKLKRTRDPKSKQDLRAQLDRHFMDLVTGGSPAGVGGPSSGGAQGLGTRIINVDARITAEVTVPAPEGLLGAGEVEGRRVAQTLGRDIAAELDPYFADQAVVIRRAVEG